MGALDSKKAARNAALSCGIVGAGVGAYMDAWEARLREQLQGTGVQVSREGDNIRLIMPGNITFNSDSYELRASFYPVLNSVGLVLSKYADLPPCESPVIPTIPAPGSTTLTLSERRADSVADYLVTRDVARDRMFVQGVAFDSPLADNASAEGRAQNRRVELYILPKTT